MGRYYKLSKTITEEQKMETLRELRELGDIGYVEINQERNRLMIQMEEGDFPEIMTKAVNIFNHASDGCELQFCGSVAS